MLWLIDDEPPHHVYPADLATSLVATAIAAGLMDAPEPSKSAEIVDLTTIRHEVCHD